MENVEPDQRILFDGGAAEQNEANPLAHNGCGARDVGSNCNCPVGQLVPGQQVAREREEQRQDQQHHAGNPVQGPVLMGRGPVLVGACQEHPHHVEKHNRHHQVCQDAMQ